MQIQTPTTPVLTEEWLHTEVTTHIKGKIRDFFEDNEYHNRLEGMWYEMIGEQNPELYKKLMDLEENPPCKRSDLWYYEEQLGKPPGFEIYIYSLVQSMELEDKYPDWNDPRKKHLGQYWINPYDINYHEKTTYTKKELEDHYKNYEKNQQDILDQINALGITQELQASLKQTLTNEGLWDKSIELKKDVEVFNAIMKLFDQELTRNITLDVIEQPREVRTPLPEYDEDFYYISIP